jgi:MFS family permease
MRCLNQAGSGGPLSGTGIFFTVFLPFALGHFLSSMLRNVNAVLGPALQADLLLTPAQLGLLTSAYFFSFALVQLPIGIALDRHGPRTVQLGMMTVAAAGVAMFSIGHSFSELLCARAVMGAGLGGCFMSAVKAMSTAVAPAKLPSVHGYLIAVGGIGAASATLPVKFALQFADWRSLFVVLAVTAAIIGLLIYFLGPVAKPAAARPPVRLTSLLEVFRDARFRDAISLILVPHAVFFGLQGLWMGRWLSDAGALHESAIAYLLYLSMAAVVAGAVLVGKVTEWASRQGIEPMRVAAGGIVLFVAIQMAMACGPAVNFPVLAISFALTGTITGLEYAIVAQTMPAAMTGRAATCLNLLIFLGAFVVQAGFGLLLACWDTDSTQHYPGTAYRTAFGVLVMLQLPGLVRFFWRRRAARRAGRAALRIDAA